MTKIEQVSREAAALSDYQLEATLEFIRLMKREPFLYQAPPEALESIARGREQIARGEAIEFEEASRRLEASTRR